MSILIFLASGAFAADLHVGQGQAYPTIASALQVAVPGDWLWLSNQVHVADVSLPDGVNLAGVDDAVLRGVGLADQVLRLEGSSVVESLVIDGNGTQRGVVVAGGWVELYEVTVRAVASPDGVGGASLFVDGGGVWGWRFSAVAEVDVGAADGGHVVVEGGGYVGLESSEIANGQSGNDGGCVFVGGGAWFEMYDSSLRDCSAGDDGGLLHVEFGGAFLIDATFERGDAGDDGGAVSSVDSWVLLANSEVLFSTAGGDGGGIFATLESIELYDTDLSWNTAVFGGGLFASGAGVYAEGLRAAGNIANAGGAIRLAGGGAVQITNSGFCWNEARGPLEGDGGAIDLTGALTAGSVLRNNAFAHNRATANGGALDLNVSNASVELTQSTFLGNIAGGQGAHVRADSGGVSGRRNNLFAFGEGPGAGLQRSGGQASIDYNAFFANQGGDTNFQLGTGNVTGQQPRILNFPQAQGECDVWGLRHAATSPLRNTGVPALLDPDGSRSDIGAFGGPGARLDTDDLDGDGYDASVDCDDTNPAIRPGATEIPLDGIDQDCDGGDLCPLDADGDGYGHPSQFASGAGLDCDTALGNVAANQTDCNDANAQVNPGRSEQTCNGVDDDCNAATIDSPDNDGDGVGVCSDCDDADPNRFPGNAEVCNGIDDNCNSLIDDGLPFTDYWLDSDGDGFADGSGAPAGSTCSAVPAGHVSVLGDCDDDAADTYPGAPESCNGRDQDCDGVADNDAIDAPPWFIDDDGDGQGAPGTGVSACVVPDPALVDNDDDCDDADSNTYTGAPELCDGADNDCDGEVDEDVVDVTWYRDADLDGWGTATVSVVDCAPPANHVSRAGDCNDGNANINPGQVEVEADGIDQNCDGIELCWADADLDGQGNQLGLTVPDDDLDCDDGEPGMSGNTLDCDDDDPSIYSGAVEIPDDGIDQDCDGSDLITIPPDTGDTGDTAAEADTDTDADTDSDTDTDTDTDADADTDVDTDTDVAPPPGSDLPPAWFCASAPGGAWWVGFVAAALARRRRRGAC